MSLAEHRSRADAALARFGATPVGHFIGGRFESVAGETFETRAPFDDTLLARVAAGQPDDVERAARAAEDAFGAWAALSGASRKALLHRIGHCTFWLRSCGKIGRSCVLPYGKLGFRKVAAPLPVSVPLTSIFGSWLAILPLTDWNSAALRTRS